MRKLLIAVLAVPVALLAACGDDGSSSGPESGLENTGQQELVPSPFRNPQPVIDALNEEVGGPNGQTRITSAGIYDGYAIFDAQDPQEPTHLDSYYTDGEFDPPEPIMTSVSGPDETELFSVGDINWAAIPDLMDEAVAQVNVEDGEASNAQVFKLSPDQIVIQISVSGSRNSGTLRADADGNVIDVFVS